jgi:hypothetical protein
MISTAAIKQTKGNFEDKFRQLDESLPTPNVYRNAAGEPGERYWQQKVDYVINATLDEKKKRLNGKGVITYKNNSPYRLKYLWLQLDQNRFKNDSMAETTTTFSGMQTNDYGPQYTKMNAPAKLSLDTLRRQQFLSDTPMGYDINEVEDDRGNKLHYVIVGSQMRIDLTKPIKSGESTKFSIEYGFNIVEENIVGARSGFEHFPNDKRKGGNDIFLLGQWFPRLVAYTDYEAWTNKEFLGDGEFTLEFGDYDVKMTVPSDHIISSTGVLQNENSVLTKTQRDRLNKAKTADSPIFIVTPDEALANEENGTNKTKTWHFKAENVRDFAWASSRKFIWDAKGYEQKGAKTPLVMAMSFFPKEGGELWSKYSTELVIHTMKVYTRFSFDYPYPTAQSVNGPVGGMEYPMITFNGPRTKLQSDGTRTYTLADKQFLVSVVIHEIGHIYFPMTVNSDERQWTWMDEGINSFLDTIACREWDPKMPFSVEPNDIVDYMKSEHQVPIMTQSDSVLNFVPNAYGKPAIAFNILRETILGRELFDFAFKEYSQRWMFKRPTPSDFFRTMEEASGVDLDWFWRGWFYTTDHVDISLDKVSKLNLDSKNPDVDFDKRRKEVEAKPASIFVEQNKEEGKQIWVKENPNVVDYHDKHDKFTVTNQDRNEYNEFLVGLKDWEKRVFERSIKEDKNYYVLDFSNKGGLVMPIILKITFTDNSTQDMRIAAEIWRKSPKAVKKLIISDKEIKELVVDPYWETADVNIENNYYPRRIIPSRIEVFKKPAEKGWPQRDLMKLSTTELKTIEEMEKDKAKAIK